MPATAELDNVLKTDIPAVNPIVIIDDEVREDVFCISIQKNVGIIPSKAVIRKVLNKDVQAPTTLNKIDPNNKNLNLLPGQRVLILENETTNSILFAGYLMAKQDQGESDTTLWTALDDRVLLQHLYVRGALVYEKGAVNKDGRVTNCKFISRYSARTNPQGYWNATLCEVTYKDENGDYVTMAIPVFAPYASIGRNYESPIEAYPPDIANSSGTLLPWTPRRFLFYLNFISGLADGEIDGATGPAWRSIQQASEILRWDRETIIGLNGFDPASSKMYKDLDDLVDKTDPLDRKMPDMNFQANRLTEAIHKTLECAGTHGVKMEAYWDTLPNGKYYYRNHLDFYPKGFTAAENSESTNIRLQRSGVVNDINTAFDFEAHEDYSEVVESVLVEGSVVNVETSITYDPTDATTKLNSQLKPAWTAEEEQAFLFCIYGVDTPDLVTRYAMIPPAQFKPGDVVNDFTTWVNCDGNGGRPFAYANTPEAIALSRQLFPTVFRCFTIDTEKIDVALSGAIPEGSTLAPYEDIGVYPRLKVNRPIYKEQLQFMLQDTLGSQDQANWTRTQYPIRIETRYKAVEDQVLTDADWTTVNYGVGMRVTGDGRIWLDSMGETVDGEQDCMYLGKLLDFFAIDAIKMKQLRFNLAMPMDHRVFGYQELQDGKSTFSDSFSPKGGKGLSGPTIGYIFSPESYREEHQVGSRPTAQLEFVAGKDAAGNDATITSPINRILPPGTEAKYAGYAARRKLAGGKTPKRNSSWKLIGIRTEYHAGDFIGKIDTGTDVNDPPYVVNAPLESVLFQFNSPQVTVCGGLESVVV